MNEQRHPGGRPRSVSLSEDEMIKLGQEMVDWVIKNNPIHLSEWYTIEKMYTYKQWKTFIQKEEFLPHYEKALKLVGLNYLNGTIKESIANRFLRNYFQDLKEEENELLKYKSDLNIKEIKIQASLSDIKSEEIKQK